jgi:hypothetical protein
MAAAAFAPDLIFGPPEGYSPYLVSQPSAGGRAQSSRRLPYVEDGRLMSPPSAPTCFPTAASSGSSVNLSRYQVPATRRSHDLNFRKDGAAPDSWSLVNDWFVFRRQPDSPSP